MWHKALPKPYWIYTSGSSLAYWRKRVKRDYHSRETKDNSKEVEVLAAAKPRYIGEIFALRDAILQIIQWGCSQTCQAEQVTSLPSYHIHPPTAVHKPFGELTEAPKPAQYYFQVKRPRKLWCQNERIEMQTGQKALAQERNTWPQWVGIREARRPLWLQWDTGLAKQLS